MAKKVEKKVDKPKEPKAKKTPKVKDEAPKKRGRPKKSASCSCA